MLIPRICGKKSGDKGKEVSSEYAEQREPQVDICYYISPIRLFYVDRLSCSLTAMAFTFYTMCCSMSATIIGCE